MSEEHSDRSEQSDRSEREEGIRQKGAAYQGAVEAVLALLLGAAIGYGLDGYLGSSPFLLFAGLALGFSAFIVRLLRLRKLLEPPQDLE